MAEEVVKKYSRKISVKKGQIGAIDGTIAGAISVVIVGLVKMAITNMTPDMENAIALLAGVVASAIVVAAKRYFDNWMKNKNLGVVAPAAPVPDQPAK